jgi:diguanylate cyclase (GGDEF)-like protein
MLLIALIPVFDADRTLLAVQAVARDISRRERTEEYVFLNATRDPLTGLQNRRSFIARLEETLALAARHSIPTSVGIINLDNFTQLNKDLGNKEGDRILIFVGNILREMLRGEDFVARSGGDEFCVLMPQVLPEAARNGLDRCLRALSQTRFSTTDGRAVPLPVTAALISIGAQVQEANRFLDRARALVMQGKAAGGNRVLTELD